MRTASRNRSHANTNRVGTYNLIDAKLDNPHLTARQLPRVVREVREIRRRDYTPLRLRISA